MRNTPIRHTLAATLCLFFAGGAAALPQTQTGPDYGYAAPAAGPAAMADSELMHGDSAVDFDGVNLQPGEFVWLPGSQVRSGTPVTFLVSLRDQRGYLYRDGQRIAVTTVSTGMPGHDTPAGVYPIIEKRKVHFSNRYEDNRGRPAAMPWMQRLTMTGMALHEGRVRAQPASHGCVRLPGEFAKQLFSLTQRGDIVLISEDTSLGALARAGADEQVGLMVGASGALNEFADRVLASDQREAEIESSATVRNTAF